MKDIDHFILISPTPSHLNSLPPCLHALCRPSGVPFDLIELAIATDTGDMSNARAAKLMKTGRLFKTMKILRLTKMTKTLKVQSYRDHTTRVHAQRPSCCSNQQLVHSSADPLVYPTTHPPTHSLTYSTAQPIHPPDH